MNYYKKMFISFISIFLVTVIFYLHNFSLISKPVTYLFNKKLPIYSVDTTEKEIALTFDINWAENDYLEDILKILDKYDVKATFFIIGKWITYNENNTKNFIAIKNAGHEIGNHSYVHPMFSKISNEQIEEELNNRKHTFEKFAYGVRRFTIGLGKKVLIANMLGELCELFTATDEKSIVFYWIFGISYMLQIYFDFSAYSDMAIGLGRIFGFEFFENFNYPYISKSITEFWRRWHISLSSWFRDYVYIPLGGSKKGKKVLVRNLLIVWTLTGIWHGASWNFVIWGLMFGIILIIEKLWLGKYIEKLPNIFKRIYVLFIVMISFIIFNANNMSDAIININGLFAINKEVFINDYTLYCLKKYFIILLISIIGATPLLKECITKLKMKKSIKKVINLLEPIFIIILLIIVTAYLVDNSYNPFLYFRF